MRNVKGKKIYTSQIRTIGIYTRLAIFMLEFIQATVLYGLYKKCGMWNVKWKKIYTSKIRTIEVYTS